jgi:hypothetical protein
MPTWACWGVAITDYASAAITSGTARCPRLLCDLLPQQRGGLTDGRTIHLLKRLCEPIDRHLFTGKHPRRYPQIRGPLRSGKSIVGKGHDDVGHAGA